MLQREIQEALEKGVTGKIITSTYQNFTDIPSLETFMDWTKKYDNFQSKYNEFDKGTASKAVVDIIKNK